MTKTAASVCGLLLGLAGTSAAAAQELSMRLGAEPGTSLLAGEPPPAARQGQAVSSIALLARFTAPPDGEIDSGTDYSDIMDQGIGAVLEFDHLLELPGDLHLGPYVSVGFDVFSGEEVTSGGVTVNADDFRLITAIVGGKLGHRPPEGVFLDGRLGVGVVHYLSTDADTTIGLATGEVELVETDTQVIGEIGARVGYATSSFFVQLGVVGRIQGGPDGGDLDLNGDTLVQYGADVGFGLRF